MVRIRPAQDERIALLGGSFNPPHVGHTAICAWILDNGRADRVWVVPCFIHPFRKKLVSFEDRMQMCRAALKRFGRRVEVVDIERRLGGTSYTVRTVEHLCTEYPGVRFSFVTGGDVEAQRHAWRDFDRLAVLAEIIAIPRGPHSPIPDVSATDIRSRVRAGRPIDGLVSPAVAAYIAKKGLYA